MKRPFKIKTAKKQLQPFLDMMPDAMSVHSRDGCITHVNTALLYLFEKPKSSYLGRSCEEAFHSHCSSCPHKEVVESGNPRKIRWSGGRSAEEHYLLIIPQFDNDGKVIGFYRILRNISEVLILEDSLLRAEQYATIGRLLSGILHDIGTPLNGISGYSEYLLMKTDTDVQGFKEVSTILEQTRRITELIKQVMELVRAPHLACDTISIKNLLSGLLPILAPSLRKAHTRVEIKCTESQSLVYRNSSMLKLAFLNLLLNLSHELVNGGLLSITVSEVSERTGYARLSISALDKNNKSSDFQDMISFLTDPEVRKEPSGVGLFLVKSVLEGIGADIIIDSNGKERNLVVYLPLRQVV